MQITQEVREYADRLALHPEEALEHGMRAKAGEFISGGGEVYTAP